MDKKPFRTIRTVLNLRQGRNDWYRITNSAGAGEPSSVHIYDEIGYFGVTADDLIMDLAGVKGDLDVHLNSPGGEVFDGIAIYEALSQRKGTVSITVDSLAASIASVIAMAASPGKLLMAKNARMMIHDGFGAAIGNAADMRQMADQLDDASDNIASIYAERTGRPADEWRAVMRGEQWYSAQAAIDAGLADGIASRPRDIDNSIPVNTWDLSMYAKSTTPVVDPEAAGQDADGDEPDKPDDDVSAEPGDAGEADTDDADTDDDGQGDDQDNDAKPATSNRAGMFPVLAVRVDESEWDEAKAWAAGAASDDPEAFYAAICAGRKAGDPDDPASWALPYRYSPSSAPNATAVRAGLAALPQARGLANAAGAEAALERLMRQVDPDYDPDALVDAALLAAVITVPDGEVDRGPWDPREVVVMATASADPAWYFRSVCAGRLPGDPDSPDAWALPYRRTPSSPPNASAVRTALAELPHVDGLTNSHEARSVLDTAMKAINPDYAPGEEIDPDLLVAAFAIGLKGAGK